MRITDVTEELKGFIQAYDWNARKDPYKDASGKPGTIKMDIPRTFRDTCADAVKRLEEMYGQAKGDDYEYPQNLMYAVGFDPAEIHSLPEDGIEYALTKLSEREQDVLRLIHKEGETLKDIGIRFGITPSRVRQIESKTLRKLRTHSLINIIKEGRAAAEAKETANAKLAESVKDLNDAIGRVRKNTETLDRLAADGCSREDAENIIKDCYRDMDADIESMGLSVRSRLCLKRSGYNKVGDLAGITMDRLMRTRNIGRKSAEEIAKRLAEWGINVQ